MTQHSADVSGSADGGSGEGDKRHELLALTPAQRGMWFADRLSPDYSVNTAQYIDIRHAPGALDIELLEKCCYEVGRELETPYIRLTEVDGVPMQYVDLEYDQTVDVLDFRGEDDPVAAAMEWMLAEYRAPVDLVTDQLIVIAILLVGEDRTLWYQRAHHLIIDGFAALTTTRRALGRYNAIRRGETAVAEPAATLAEIVEYETSYLDSRRRESDREHWRQRAEGLPERATMARSNAVAPLSFDNVVAGAALPPSLQSRLDEMARELNSSIPVILTAAFSAFLARMTGADDIVLSLPVTGRATAKIKNSGGMVSNVLPVRLDDVRASTVRDLIRAGQLEMTGALRHQRYRTEDIRRDAGLGGSSVGFGPVINMVLFDAPVEVDGADLDYRILASGVLEDLLVNLYQSGPGAPLVIDLHGNPHLYTQEEIDGHHRRFIAFLERFVGAVDQPVAQLELLVPGEPERLSHFESGPSRAEVPAQTGGEHLLDLFTEQARRTPDAIAVIDGDESWTYRDFDALRHRAADCLRMTGVRRGDRVAVALPRGAAQVAVIYGALTVGAAFVPVDPEQPDQRRELIVAAARPAVVVDVRMVDDAGLTDRTSLHSGARQPAVAHDSMQAAYVIFTSGSTGTPKGVQVSHRAIANRLAWVQDDFPIEADDVWLYKTPFTFDPSVIELLWPLQRGATLVIAKPGGHRDPRYLTALAAEHGVTVLHFVPSMLDVLADTADEQILPSSVRRIFVSGEALPTSLAEKVRARSEAEVVNLYGPTEAAVDVTEYVVRAGDEHTPIGTPVAGTRALVLDTRLERQPVGVAGELYLAGVQLADGYVGRPGMTAERFVADPDRTGERLYRTGDLARWNDAGELEYLGRTDFQIKIRGQRVELGEIEAILVADESVDTAVALLDPESSSVVAYVRLTHGAADGGPVDGGVEEHLIARCGRHLPAYMVPAAVMVLDDFPLTSSGKLDRRALPVPQFAEAAAVEHVPPESPVEHTLAGLLSDLLERSRIGMRDNIFHLGADSLTAARLAARARSVAGLHLSLSDIFECDTVGGLARAARPVAVDRPPLEPVRRPEQIPLSFPQTRLWFINRIDPQAPTYNMAGAVRLPAGLDFAALETAVGDLLDRHESLRTRFPSVAGEPIQDIVDAAEAQAPIQRIETGQESLHDAVTAESSAGFDLTIDLPVRFAALTVVDDGAVTGHVLSVVLHHIAGDGASLTPLITDLLTAYFSRAAGSAPAWDPLPVQYADYALWQRRVLGEPDDADSRLATELSFWTDQLAELPEVLNLPTDFARTGAANGAGDFVDKELSAGTVARLRALARAEGVTTFAVLHAALAQLLARLCHTDDVAIGTAVAGRDEPELSGLIGMFVNTVVLRTQVRPGDTVAELVGHAHSVRSSALEHSSVPFEAVVDAVGHSRSLSHSPLFQVALTLTGDHRSALEGTDIEVLQARPAVAKYDLSITATESGSEDRIGLEFSFATDVFRRSTVERFGEYLERLILAMADDPTRAVGSLPLLSTEETAALTATAEGVTAQTARALVAAQEALCDPSQPAVIGASIISQGVFAMRSNQLARELIARGAGPGAVVALALPRSELSVLACTAVVKTGAAFVSIDPRHPEDRRAMMLSTSRARLGLTASRVEMPGHDEIDWLTVDEAELELHIAGRSGAPIDDHELVRVPQLDDAAYLIFTSGSTGLPKATVVPNRGIANLLTNQRRRLGLDHSARVLHVASPSFDASVFEMAMAVAARGPLVTADVHTYAGHELERLIAENGVTHAVMTPSALATLDPGAVPTLTTVLSAGEACPPELMRRWAAAGVRFLNLYGPTEATIWATADGPLSPDDEITIGRAVDGVGALVLDSGLQLTPDGVLGELYLTGDQLALGYLQRSGQTAGAFVANPFDPGERMYRTGDLAVRREDGRLIYRGRGDFQLKVRGMRIEPGEVDAVLTAHPAVANAISIGIEGPAGETVLISYVTPAGDATTISPDDLLGHAGELLPSHMVPHTVMVIEEFPTTVVGKIDRKKLPPVDFRASTTFIPPRNEMEAVVAEVYSQTLGVDRVSVQDSFFELGGTSLSAAKLANQLSHVLGRTVSVKTVFEKSTVAGIASAIAALSTGAPGPALVARRRAELVPVSDVQRGMWLLNQADPSSPAYNIAMALRLDGELDQEALVQAVADLVERQEALRTSYPMVGGRPVQLIETADTVLASLDLTPHPVAAENLSGAVAAVTGRGFDVTKAAPLRVALLRLDDDAHVVAFVVHHISADGASMAPLAHDFITAYSARNAGHPPSWMPLRVQYADFAVWQEERLTGRGEDDGTERDRQLAYWREQLAGAPERLELPTDRPRPPTPSYSGATVGFEIPGELVASLQGVARQHNTTLFMVTHAALAILLSRLSGQTDVVIGTPYAGRSEPVLDKVVGMFVNTLALRSQMSAGEPFAEFLARVRSTDLAGMAHADVAFDSVVAAVGAGPTVAFNPVFQAMFTFQNLEFPTLYMDKLTISPVSEELSAAKVDLQLTLFPNDPAAVNGQSSGTSMRGEFLYAADLFDARTVELHTERYLAILQQIAEDPQVAVGDVSIATVSDRERGAGAASANDRALSELLADAAAVAPDSVAVDAAGAVVTFSALSVMATALATAMPDADAALTTALMTSAPALGAAGPAALGEALDELRRRAVEAIDTDSAQREGGLTQS